MPAQLLEAGGMKNDDLEQESKLIKSYNQIIENFRRSWGDKIVSTDGRTDGRMDGQTNRLLWSHSTNVGGQKIYT